MKKTEFISNLAFFRKEDYDTFLLFLRSPVFKKHGGLDKVFKVIAKRRKMLDSGDTDELKKTILKVAGITEKTLMKIFSQLNESLIEYYRYKALYSSELYSAIALNDYMLGVNNPVLAQIAGSHAEQLLKDRFGENEQYFHNAFVYSAGKLNRLVHEQMCRFKAYQTKIV